MHTVAFICNNFPLVRFFTNFLLTFYFGVQICNNGRCVLENENAIPDFASEDIGLNSFLKRTDTIQAVTEPKPFFQGPAASTLGVYNPTTTSTTTVAATTTSVTTTTAATTTSTASSSTLKPLTTAPWWHTSSKTSTPSTR